MRTNKDKIYELIKLHCSANEEGVSTQHIADTLGIKRSNVSKILNELVVENRIKKSYGRPVLYYAAVRHEHYNCFDNLVGIDTSLRRAVHLIEVGIMYPEKGLGVHITGSHGTGKSLLAMVAHEYAIECGAVQKDSPYLVFDALPYTDNEMQAEQELESTMQKAAGGILLVDNAHRLSRKLRIWLCRRTEFKDFNVQLIVITDSSCHEAAEDMRNGLPITVEMPTLAERSLCERFELVQRFLALESARASKPVLISSDVLCCLLLYDTPYNITQLKRDIKTACACAYVRSVSSEEDSFEIYKGDFENYVRKGLLNYNARKQELEQLITPAYKYTYSKDTVKMSPMDRDKLLYSFNLYKELEQKSLKFRSRGVDENEISLLLEAELESSFNDYKVMLTRGVTSMEQLSKMVDKGVIDMTENFLDEAAAKFSKVYPQSIHYGLCLHIDCLIKGRVTAHQLSAKQVSSVLERNHDEYGSSLRFAAKLEEKYGISKLPLDEIIFITMFIALEPAVTEPKAKPGLLLAMKGNIASALADCVSSNPERDGLFTVDLPLKEDNQETYRLLRESIENSESGNGLVVMCGSEDIHHMIASIQEETEKNIRVIDMHINLFAEGLARIIKGCDSVDTLCEKVVDTIGSCAVRRRHVIVVLCSTGKGGSEQMAKYIEAYGQVGNTAVLPLATADREVLRDQLVQIMQTSIIDCVVGIQDPQLFSLPFVRLSDVLASSPDTLPDVLKYGGNEKGKVNYDDVYAYLDEWLDLVDVKRLRRVLPIVMENINSRICELSLDTEVGLFIHLACCINRLKSNEAIKPNPHKDEIFHQYSKQVKMLLTIISPLEKSFGVVFSDDEVANILTIIYHI